MSRWIIIENIAAEIGSKINSGMDLSPNFVKNFMVVLLGITQYELVPAPGSPGTSRCI